MINIDVPVWLFVMVDMGGCWLAAELGTKGVGNTWRSVRALFVHWYTYMYNILKLFAHWYVYTLPLHGMVFGTKHLNREVPSLEQEYPVVGGKDHGTVLPCQRGCQKREEGRHLPNNGAHKLPGKGQGEHGAMWWLARGGGNRGKSFFSGAFSGNSVGIGGEQIDKAGAEKAWKNIFCRVAVWSFTREHSSHANCHIWGLWGHRTLGIEIGTLEATL